MNGNAFDLSMSVWRFPLAPEQASSVAGRIDWIMIVLLVFSVTMTVLVCAAILYFIVRYRAGSNADRSNPVRQSWKYEVVWATIPAVLVLGIGVWAAYDYFRIAFPPPDADTIYVVGKQWMWKVNHPTGQQEINTLHVPVGRPVQLVMTSQDVIHSFYIPAFRVKKDVLPDRYSRLWFEATEPGVYPLFCAEYCGRDHSHMTGRVVAMRPDNFAEWLNAEAPGDEPDFATPGTPEAPMALRGEGLFYELGCIACHTPQAAVRAPRLDGLFGGQTRLDDGQLIIADEDYIRESILYPNAKIVAGYPRPSLMPTYKGQITPSELQELVEWIKSIRHGWTPPVEEAGDAETAEEAEVADE